MVLYITYSSEMAASLMMCIIHEVDNHSHFCFVQEVYEYVFGHSELLDRYGIFTSFPRQLVSPEHPVSDLQGVLTVEEGEGIDPLTFVSWSSVD